MAAKTSVLLVEGSDDDAALVTRALAHFSRTTFVVDRVSTLAEALHRLQRETKTYDAIIEDLSLPDSSGLASFSAIHACSGKAAVVVLTDADDREELGLRAVQLGAQEFIVKDECGWHTLAVSLAYACERARRQQEIEELTSALASAVDAIATLDRDGTFIAVNGAFQSLFGYLPDEIIGTPLLDLIDEADRTKVFGEGAHDATSTLATTTTTTVVESVRAIRKGGRIVSLQLAVSARAGGRGYFCFARDLTQQKQLEGRLAAAAAITAVGSLTTGLAHEINNPLAVILANVEEAARVAKDMEASSSSSSAAIVPESAKADLADLRAMMDEAYSATRRVQFLVRDLRVFACADHRRGRVDVNALIEACCNIAIAEIRHRARLVKDLKANVPVLGSEAKLAQVFLNLLINAAHAMPESQGDSELNEITVTTRSVERSGGIVVEISDTGSGIAQSAVAHVFEAFYTTKPRRPGMGLAICQATVNAHGGEISIHPREDGGRGTIVRVQLPSFESEAVLRRNGSPSVLEGGAVQHRRVLVVDDDPLVLRSLTRVLARDFEVASARNGREALDLVRAGGTFDAMLCDLMMPELSGIELHALLEQDDPELAKRTVFLTGGAFIGRAQTFLEAVGQPHLEKPVDLKRVRDLLLELSQTPHGGRSLQDKWL